MFQSLDRNGDGLLSPQEIREGLISHALEVPQSLEDILRGVDSDGSGCLDYTEFVAATVDRRIYAQRGVLRAAFRTFDLDGDGKISKQELRQVLGREEGDERTPSERRIDSLLGEADADGDGYVDFEEFFAMMTAGQPEVGEAAANCMTLSSFKTVVDEAVSVLLPKLAISAISKLVRLVSLLIILTGVLLTNKMYKKLYRKLLIASSTLN